MNATAQRVVKTLALLASALTALLVVALFAPMPGPTWWSSFLANNALLCLMVSTPIAATLLTVAQKRWARTLPLCALVPSTAALIFMLTFELLAMPGLEVLAVVGFLLVEVALPVAALLVVFSALAFTVHEAVVWLRSRRLPQPA